MKHLKSLHLPAAGAAASERLRACGSRAIGRLPQSPQQTDEPHAAEQKNPPRPNAPPSKKRRANRHHHCHRPQRQRRDRSAPDRTRIVVCDILPLPSVLSVFFDSAEKLVGIAPSSMSAAQNSLLSQLYPEILNAETGFMNGTDVNTEELMKLAPDVVFYSAMNPALGEKLQTAGFCAVAVSANKWEYDCIETLNNWIDLLSSDLPGK